VAPASVSVVLPCLDEEGTVGDCVREAREGIAALGREGEVVVVDNGSTDGSVAAAEAAGARVVAERRRGYGSALARGIREAKGGVVVLGDADGSYRFDRLGPLVEAVDGGADLVLGSRLKGTIEPGAMPRLNRYLGTPLLTLMVRLLFGARISDVNTGQRALSRRAARTLRLRAAGMEFASEMVIKAALARLVVTEVPIRFFRDRRGRPPHLRRWRDGWRHLRFILLFAPNAMLIAPGLALFLVGCVLGAPAFAGRENVTAAAGFAASLLVLVGAQLMQVGFLAKVWYHVEGFFRRPYLERVFRYLTLEAGILLGLGLVAVGVVVGLPLLAAWRTGERPDATRAAVSLTYMVLGMQLVASSVILSVIGIRRR